TEAVRTRRGPLDWLALAAPAVFVVGLLVGVSLLLHALLDTPPNWERGLDTADWMRRAEPPHPPVRVTETTSGQPSRVGHIKEEGKQVVQREVREQEQVFDELAVSSRVYWLGMFNTDATFVPRPKYQLQPDDLRYLKEKRGLDDDVLGKL